MLRSVLTAGFTLALPLALSAACSGGNDPGTGTAVSGVCRADTAPACPPKPWPSYASEIAPLLAGKCSACHAAGLKEWPLDNYTDLVHWRDALEKDILRCTMPPADAGETLTAEERQKIIVWAACGGPNN